MSEKKAEDVLLFYSYEVMSQQVRDKHCQSLLFISSKVLSPRSTAMERKQKSKLIMETHPTTNIKLEYIADCNY